MENKCKKQATELQASQFQEIETDAVLIECNIDDMNPERYSYVMERLFEAGADDVYLQNIIMKKSRPGVKLSALCTPDKEYIIKSLIFTETTTLGVRCQYVKKTALERRSLSVETPWGTVRIKEAYFQGKKIKAKPEYDDCAAIAKNHGISLESVYELLNTLM